MSEMRRNEIERRVNEMVFDNYDYKDGTLDIVVPLMPERYAFITKEPGFSPECEICDDSVEGDGELPFPNVCAFIEKVVEECIKDIVGQHDSPDYDREMFEEWLRGGWR